MRSVSRRIYEPGSTPFGPLDIVRFDRRLPQRAQALAMNYAGRTVQQAWLESEWFARLEQPEAARAHKISVSHPSFMAGVMRTMQRALRGDGQESVWLAAHPGWGVSPVSLAQDSRNGLINPLVGYAHAKHDVSGSRLEQRLKRTLYPSKVYAAVGDVAVQTAWQRSGIGIAMSDAALSDFADDKVPTTYVLGTHNSLTESLEQYGYQITGQQLRDDLVEGLQIPETRMQADSVGAVRERMIRSHPWLQEVVEP